jgi:hypothetical protein
LISIFPTAFGCAEASGYNYFPIGNEDGAQALKTRKLLQGSGTTKSGQFSPDGKWLAYTL